MECVLADGIALKTSSRMVSLGIPRQKITVETVLGNNLLQKGRRDIESRSGVNFLPFSIDVADLGWMHVLSRGSLLCLHVIHLNPTYRLWYLDMLTRCSKKACFTRQGNECDGKLFSMFQQPEEMKATYCILELY